MTNPSLAKSGFTPLETELIAALKPFADFAPNGTLNGADRVLITHGSSIAKRQLTLQDCYNARAALAKADQ